MTERRLTPADACWLYSDFEGNHQIVSSLMWTDREVDPAEYRRIVKERMVDQYPVFSQRIRKSRNPLLLPHWEDDPDFDLDYHVDVIQLPEPGDRAALEALVSEQRSVLLDPDKPLWRFHLIQGYNGGSAIHARIQHAIADGWALVRVIMSLADEAVDAPPVPIKEREPKTSKLDTAKTVVGAVVDSVTETAQKAVGAVVGAASDPSSIPSMLSATAEDALSIVPDPGRLLEFGSALPGLVTEGAQSVPGLVVEQAAPVTGGASTAVGAAGDAIDFLNSPKPGKTILHGKVSGKKKIAWIDPIPLQPIKDAGRVFGATINDMLLAATTNSLRRYLLDKNALDVEYLLVAVPVSLRKPTDPLPRDLGNKFGLINVLLPVGIEDAVEQVEFIKEQIDEIKKSQIPIVSFGLASVLSLTGPDVEQLVHKITQDQSAGVVTNVPGPRGPLTLAGANVIGAWGMGGVGGNMNLTVAIFSMNGEINFAIGADTAITGDPERILSTFTDSIDELLQRAGISATVG